MTPQLKRWIFRLLAFAGVAVVVMVLVYFLRRFAALRAAEASIAEQREKVKPDGTPVLPPVQPPTSTPPIGGGGQPQPPVTNEVSSHIEKLCWMTDEIVKTKGGSSAYRCEVCNNLGALSQNDLNMWAKTYQQWYGRSLKADLTKPNLMFDCGCIPFFCSCSKPEPKDLAKLP